MELISANPKVYKNHRTEPYFSYVRDGQKTIEGRLYKKLYKELTVGDSIHVYNYNETESFLINVVGLRMYHSFRELLTHEVLSRVLPNTPTISDGVAIYEQFYTPEQQNEFGVVAIEVVKVI